MSIDRRLAARLAALMTTVAALGVPELATAGPGVTRNAVIAGHLTLCGGPPPVPPRHHGCFIGGIGYVDRVEAIDSRGRRVAIQKLRNARFRFRVRPGTYLLLLLADHKGVRHVGQRQHVTARAHHTSVVVFFFTIH